jgi:hypothetical protein
VLTGLVRNRPLRRVALVSALLLCSVAGLATALAARSAGAQVPARRAASRAAGTRRHAPMKMIWGPVVLPSGQSAFPTYHRLGVQVLQLDLQWAEVAPTRPADATNPSDPAYQWPAALDQAAQQAAHYGIALCLQVKYTPPWANDNRSTTYAPDNVSDYANFLIAAAHRYPTIRYWMIWGEPNRGTPPDFLPMPYNSPAGPRRYALLLNAGYHALKAVSRSNIVIGGNTWSFGRVEPAAFLRDMRLPNGKPPPLDYYGHNPFGLRFPKLSDNPYFPGGRDINDIDSLENQLKATYHRSVKLWLSEFTISSDHNTRAFDFHTSRKGQARWLRAAFKLVNSVNYVAGLGWFTLLDSPATGPVHKQLTNGLMTYGQQHKPAFRAYATAR